MSSSFWSYTFQIMQTAFKIIFSLAGLASFITIIHGYGVELIVSEIINFYSNPPVLCPFLVAGDFTLEHGEPFIGLS